ncbi:MAG: CapA family protein [Candidatus Taylorbacteria bacterium]|nr:CapA family protein [Candidatus Taylorbacteria bacterium]
MNKKHTEFSWWGLIVPVLVVAVLLTALFVFDRTYVPADGINSDNHSMDSFALLNTETNAEKKDAMVRMLFVGDMMFDRGVASHAQKYGIDSLFSNIERLFLDSHMIVGNLEGTITNKPSLAEKDHSVLRFTFDPMFAGLLKRLNFSAVSLANNHALDFYGDGYYQTVRNLATVGIASFGSPRNDENISMKFDVQGKTICLVGYHDLYIPDPAPALKEVGEIRPDCSYVVLSVHWGDEYKQTVTERQKMLARKFIDAGVDLIIGAHPHVVEPVEIYKNKAIFYSLGNFIFDQNLSFATEHGLVVGVEWNGVETKFNLIPTVLNRGEVALADSEDSQKVISFVASRDLLSEDLYSDIQNTSRFTLRND